MLGDGYCYSESSQDSIDKYRKSRNTRRRKIETDVSRILGYVCAVPGCPRRHDEQKYIVSGNDRVKESEPQRNRLEAARDAILEAIRR